MYKIIAMITIALLMLSYAESPSSAYDGFKFAHLIISINMGLIFFAYIKSGIYIENIKQEYFKESNNLKEESFLNISKGFLNASFIHFFFIYSGLLLTFFLFNKEILNFVFWGYIYTFLLLFSIKITYDLVHSVLLLKKISEGNENV